jgi:hypothetical protein
VPEREALTFELACWFGDREGTSTVHEGRVVRLSPSVDESNRTLLVETEIPNPSMSSGPALSRVRKLSRLPASAD